MHPIEKVIKDCDKAIVNEDFETLMENYTENAILAGNWGQTTVSWFPLRFGRKP